MVPLRVALCPHPPLLMRELSGLADPGASVRTASVEAVREVAEGVATMVLVGAHPAVVVDPSLPLGARRFGGLDDRRTGEATLPLPLAVGRRLLEESGWAGPVELRGVPQGPSEGGLEEVAGRLLAFSRGEPTGLLLLGDGSARRDPRAPGHLDPRAQPYDDAVARALASGDARTLADLDPLLGEELLAAGAPVHRLLGVLGQALGVREARVTYRDDPFGVDYVVARWDLG